MNRKTFIGRASMLGLAAAAYPKHLLGQSAPVYGHNGMHYRQVKDWGVLDAAKTPVNDCHEMVQDDRGRLYLLTNETRNNVLIYDTRGRLKSSWGTDYPGGHGLTIAGSGADQFLLITDTSRHQVYQTTLTGRVLLTLDYPKDAGIYSSADQFVPTETAVAPNGDIYVADGYGQQYILRYGADGRLKDGLEAGEPGDHRLDNAHGVALDQRAGTPTLLVTDRTRCCFKRFSLEGDLIEIISIPGACVCRPVVHGDHVYAAVLRSPDMDQPNSGFVAILDKSNRVVSTIGGSEPIYQQGKLQTLQQSSPLFAHPHDVCVDKDENIYVAQWASGKVYPYKFERI